VVTEQVTHQKLHGCHFGVERVGLSPANGGSQEQDNRGQDIGGGGEVHFLPVGSNKNKDFIFVFVHWDVGIE
jgi:hypothetical protein